MTQETNITHTTEEQGMFNVHKVSLDFFGAELTLETGKIARQADGSVILSYDNVVIHAAVTYNKNPGPEQDFFPLSVHYQEKFYAAGKIPGGYFKREARPTEQETLISRLIDRPIRPLFPKHFYNEVQVIVTLMSHNQSSLTDVLAIIAASAAISISGLPFQGPVAATRVGYINNEYVFNPNIEQLKQSDLDLVVSATSEAVLMVESEAKQLDEATMLNAVNQGFEAQLPVIKAINLLKQLVNNTPLKVQEINLDKITTEIKQNYETSLREAYSLLNKQERREKIDKIKKLSTKISPRL